MFKKSVISDFIIFLSQNIFFAVRLFSLHLHAILFYCFTLLQFYWRKRKRNEMMNLIREWITTKKWWKKNFKMIRNAERTINWCERNLVRKKPAENHLKFQLWHDSTTLVAMMYVWRQCRDDFNWIILKWVAKKKKKTDVIGRVWIDKWKRVCKWNEFTCILKHSRFRTEFTWDFSPVQNDFF